MNASQQHEYEGWIQQTNGQVRIVSVFAPGHSAAFKAVTAQCADGESCRGVNPIDDTRVIEEVSDKIARTFLGKK